MSRIEEVMLPVISGEARGVGAAALRGVLRGFSLIYLGGIETYLACYRFGLLKRTKLPCKVIAVGNLTMGGTGKTTTVRALVRKLTASGVRVAVLSYGYRADHQGPPSIVSDGERILMTPAEAGDEAVMLARDLPGIPVIIGPKRIDSGKLAAERFQVDAVLLDDGFQYWRLAKDLEVVLLDATQPFGYGAVIPRGLLREPVHHLARAGAVIITHADLVSAQSLERLEAIIHRVAPGIPVARARHAPSALRKLTDNTAQPLEWLQGRRVLALSSLGNPGGFERTLSLIGAEVVESVHYQDHHHYTREEIADVEDKAVACGAEAILTTEKDAVKIDPNWSARLIHALSVELQFLRGEIEIDDTIKKTFKAVPAEKAG